MNRTILPLVVLAALLAPAARGTVLVYDGFHPADYNNVAAGVHVQASTTFAAGHTTGIGSSGWSGMGGTQIRVFGENYGLALPSKMTDAGFTALGGSIGCNPSSNNADMRAMNHALASNALKASAGTNLYVRMLLNVDATAAGKLSAMSAPASSSGKYFGAGFCIAPSGNNYYLLTSTKSALAFVVWKNSDNQYVLSFAHTTAAGTTATFYPLVTGITLGETYLCYAEIRVEAGTDGNEIVRAGAVAASDFTGAAPWASLGGSSDSVEVELVSESAYPTAMAVAGPYGTNNGYFRADELVVGTEMGDILPVGGVFAVTASGTPTVGQDTFSTDWLLVADEGVTADAGLVWSTDSTFAAATTNSLGTDLAAGTRSTSLAGLEPDTTYWWKIYADNGTDVAETSVFSFTTAGAPVLGACSATVAGESAAFSVALAEAALDGTTPTSVSVFYGTDGETWTELPLGASSTATNWTQTVAGLGFGATYRWFVRATATMAGGRVLSAESATKTFTTLYHGDMYVDLATANAVKPYSTPETAAPDIATALAVATDGATVHVAPGRYEISTPLSLAKAVRIVGDDADPSRVVVANTAEVNQYNQNRRCIRIDHAGAVVSGIAFENGKIYGQGGNVLIDSNGGMVTNCILSGGYARSGTSSAGANVSIQGPGRVTHCTILGGWQNNCSGCTKTSSAHVGHADARMENCLVDGFGGSTVSSQATKNACGIYVEKGVAANCTVVNCTSPYTEASGFAGILIPTDDGLALNCVSVANADSNGTVRAFAPSQVSRTSHCAFDAIAGEAAVPEGMAGAVVGTPESFFPRFADDAIAAIKYRPGPSSPLLDAGEDYAPMAAFDLSGQQPRRVGASVDIGCYEDGYLAIEATGEPTVGLESFATDFVLGTDVPADVWIVWSADASFAAASTNRVAEGATNGVHEAAVGGLATDTAYWWKLVATNGVFAVETEPASFRTLGAPVIGGVSESVGGATVQFSVDLASVARDALGNGIRTYVTVFCSTNGTDWIEQSLGSAIRARTVLGAATLPNGVWTWYAVARAESGGRTFAAESGTRTFRVFHNATPPAGFRRVDVEIAYDGEPAEDIPVLLRLSEEIEGFRYADVANDGRDFLFSDGDGNRLPFEIDTWNPEGESLVWVRLPVFADGATIHLDYGASDADGTADAADVWRRYVAVWHMNEIRTDAATGRRYTPDSSASGWHAFANAEADAFPKPVTAAPGATANPTPPTGTAMNVAYGAGKSKTSLGGFTVPASRTASTTLNGPGFTLSAFVNSHQVANNGRCRVIAFGNAPSDRANLAVGSDRIYCMGSNSHNKANPKGATDWVWATDVFASPRSKIYADGVCLSGGSEGNPDLASLALDKGVGLGCFTDGTQCLDGYLDEARIRNAASTAGWTAAEYAAMADGTNVVRFGGARYLEMPVLEAPPSLAWYRNGFVHSATVAYGRGDVLLATVDLYDGSATTNAAHSFDSAASLPQALSENVELAENRMYRGVAILRSPDGSEEDLAAARETVYSGSISVTWVRDADIAAMTPAIVRLSRADTEAATCAPLEVSFALSGEAVSKGLVEPVASATIPAGESFVEVEIRPIARSVVPGDYLATLTVAGTNVARPGAQVEFGVRNAGADPYVRYVAPNGDDGNDGALATTPKRTVAAALASFSENARSVLCTVHVAPGLYPVSSPIVLTNAVRIIGDDSDPSRVVVSNTTNVDYYNQNHRCIRLDHADAVVSGMTFENGKDYGNGGNVRIDANGGMVTNCILVNGYTREGSDSGGANVAIQGPGLVTHCRILGGSQNNCSGCKRVSSVCLEHADARIENCLVSGFRGATVSTQPTVGCAGILVDKGAAINCMVVDCTSPYTTASGFAGILLWANGRAVDCVSVGNVDSNGTVRAFMASQATRAINCAFDAIAGEAVVPEGMVGAVVGTPASFFRNYARGDYRPRSGGPLVNAGANYEPMAGVDLSGVQPRKVGTRVDIGCYEGFAETTILILR